MGERHMRRKTDDFVFRLSKIENEPTYSQKVSYNFRRNLNKSAPTRADYINTCSFLRDFGIKKDITEIPKFKKREQLLNWRMDCINKRLERSNTK